MSVKVIGIITSLLVAMPTWAAYEKDAWVTSQAYPDFHVVVSASASVSEKFAASEFCNYWKKTTGHEIQSSTQAMEKKVNVWIGKEGIPPYLLDGILIDDFGDEDFMIRSRNRGDTRKIQSDHLFILGGRKRGTLYGVYEFFEKVMGVRWLTPEFTWIPPAAPDSIQVQDFAYSPPFEYRETNYRAFVQNPYFALVHRLNGHHLDIPEEWGGHIAYTKAGYAHTFHNLVSPLEYGQSHPDYFSEIKGERHITPHSTQLDLTHPDVFKMVVEKTENILENAAPNEKISSISQMDWPYWCESWPMRTIDELEGAHSGSLIRFINEVADAVAVRFPDIFIDTFAYTFTRKPPRFARPRNNVIVRLCSIECDFARPLSDSKSRLNRAFRKDLQGWARITKNLYVWDYTQNWYCFQGPHPNFHVIQPNLKFLSDNRVKGVFEQASPVSPHSDFEYLKGYLIAESLWNPRLDWEEAFNEFVDLYYLDAAPYIREYIALITTKAQKSTQPMTIFSKMEWMDGDTVVAAESIFQRAFAAIQNDEIRERLKIAHLPVQYAALVCPPHVEVATGSYILTRPPSQTFDEYWNMIQSYGITHLQDTPIEELRTRLNGTTPPRHEAIPIVRLQSPFSEVWITPTLGGAVRRWLDQRYHIEVFNGFENPTSNQWIWQEWELMDPDNPAPEKSLVSSYQVIQQNTHSVVLQAGLSNGLVLTRTMTLDMNAPVLAYTLGIHNTSSQAVLPRLKIHPEIWTQGSKHPELWVKDKDGWVEKEMEPSGTEDIHRGTLDPEGILSWAMRISSRSTILVNAIESSELEALAYYHNPEKDHLNLELIPKQTPLAPGEKREIHSKYEVVERLGMDDNFVRTSQTKR